MIRIICLLTLGIIAALSAIAADQPQWGERFSRNMVSAETGLPDSFDPATGKNIKWSVPLGTETFSTPIIAGGRVYIGTNNNQSRDPRHKGDRGVVMCFDEKDGRFLWQLVVPKITTSVYWDWPNDGLCSPATVEGDRVYIVSNRGEVMCLDAHGQANGNDGPYLDEARHSEPPDAPPVEATKTEGDIFWLYDMVKNLGVRQHDSAHASILLHGRFLYVNTSNGVDDSHKRIDAPDAPSLIVFDKTTGKFVATDAEHMGPKTFHSTWSSPSLADVGGRPLVFFAGGNGIVYAFEALQTVPPAGQVAKLKKVWSFDFDPASPKENVHQYNSNRQVSPSNFYGMPVVHEGHVYVAGGGDLWWGKHEAWLKCIDAAKGTEVWSYPLDRHVMATPAVYDGLVFIGDCGRKIHCLDAATGEPHWTHEAKGDIWASPLVADGKLYIGTRRKELLVFAASKEKQLLSTVELDSAMHGSPVAANGTLYIATMKTLYAVQQQQQQAAPGTR